MQVFESTNVSLAALSLSLPFTLKTAGTEVTKVEQVYIQLIKAHALRHIKILCLSLLKKKS